MKYQFVFSLSSSQDGVTRGQKDKHLDRFSRASSDLRKELVIKLEQNKHQENEIAVTEKLITAAVILPLKNKMIHIRMNSLISFFLPSENLNFLNITKKYYLKYLNKEGSQQKTLHFVYTMYNKKFYSIMKT